MKATDVASACWVALALAGVAWTGARGAEAASSRDARATAPQVAADATYTSTPDGEHAVIDADGYAVPVRPYARIAAASTTADQLLLALVEPERVDALTGYGREHTDTPHLYGQRFAITGLHQQEILVQRRVDLLVLNKLGGQAPLARLRASGLEVFNLGEMRGLETLVPNIHALAAVLGVPERGELLAARWLQRFEAVAADIPPARKKRAVYVSAYANQLFGGARGTSYHDVLVHAGLLDAAEAQYAGFLQYDPEQLVELDPELIVANDSTAEALCQVAGLSRLRACQHGGAGVIALSPDLLSDPGLRMLEAAEALRNAVYGRRGK